MTKQTAVETIATNGGIAPQDAERVFDYYAKVRILTFNAHDGYQLRHGVFFERNIIVGALTTLNKQG